MRASTRRRSDPPDPAAQARARAGDRVHQRRRAGRGDADEHPAAQADPRGEHAAEEGEDRGLAGLTSPLFNRKTEGSVVCPSCGSLVGVRDDKCYSCGRANPGLWGFAPAIRAARPRHGVRAAGDRRFDPSLRAGALRLGREHPRRRRAEHPVAEHLGAALVRRERRGAGLLPGRLVDGAERVLAARRPAAHLVQHDVGAQSRAECRRNHRPGPDGDSLHRLGRDGVPFELGDGRRTARACRFSAAPSSRSARRRRCSGCSGRWCTTAG